MKTNALLLSLACLGLTNLVALASSTEEETEIVQLPAYVVTAPRQTEGEREIKKNLDALRAVASKPVAVHVTLPSLEKKNSASAPDEKKPAKSVVVAGL